MQHVHHTYNDPRISPTLQARTPVLTHAGALRSQPVTTVPIPEDGTAVPTVVDVEDIPLVVRDIAVELPEEITLPRVRTLGTTQFVLAVISRIPADIHHVSMLVLLVDTVEEEPDLAQPVRRVGINLTRVVHLVTEPQEVNMLVERLLDMQHQSPLDTIILIPRVHTAVHTVVLSTRMRLPVDGIAPRALVEGFLPIADTARPVLLGIITWEVDNHASEPSLDTMRTQIVEDMPRSPEDTTTPIGASTAAVLIPVLVAVTREVLQEVAQVVLLVNTLALVSLFVLLVPVVDTNDTAGDHHVLQPLQEDMLLAEVRKLIIVFPPVTTNPTLEGGTSISTGVLQVDTQRDVPDPVLIVAKVIINLTLNAVLVTVHPLDVTCLVGVTDTPSLSPVGTIILTPVVPPDTLISARLVNTPLVVQEAAAVVLEAGIQDTVLTSAFIVLKDVTTLGLLVLSVSRYLLVDTLLELVLTHTIVGSTTCLLAITPLVLG